MVWSERTHFCMVQHSRAGAPWVVRNAQLMPWAGMCSKSSCLDAGSAAGLPIFGW